MARLTIAALLVRTFLAMALAAGGTAAHAISLTDAYDAALRNDPVYRARFYENESAKESTTLGRAGLLPNVSASYSAARNSADLEYQLPDNATVTQPRYRSNSGTVQVRQPLLNLEAFQRYRQGRVRAERGQKQFDAATNEVAQRVVGAYFDALFAEDQVALVRVQREVYLEQQKLNARFFEKGEGTKTDMLETQVRLDVAEADLIEAQDNVALRRRALAGVIGIEPGTLEKVGERFTFAELVPGDVAPWRSRALSENGDLAAARLAVEEARLEIKRQRAGHLPRVDLVANYSRGNNETLNTYGQATTNRQISIQVNVPLYAGGAVSASTRQAGAEYGRLMADLESRTNAVVMEVEKAHAQVKSSVGRIRALLKAVDSAKTLIIATERSISGGVRINLDLLNARQQLFLSQRDLASARYAYLLGLIRLHGLMRPIGQVDFDDIFRTYPSKE